MDRDGWNGPITFRCDTSSDEIDTGESDFAAALEHAKGQGWVAYRDPLTSEWKHRSPDATRGSEGMGPV